MQSECIVWTKAKAGKGYGVKMVDGRMQYVHRIAAEKAFGPIPDGMVVAHKCDNPACHNPDHLFVCTQKENLADMKAKGRSAKGDKHRSKTHPELVLKGSLVGGSKLSESDVLMIRSEYKKCGPGKRQPTSLTAIAEKYGIAFQTVSKIVNRKTWSHV